MKYNDKLTKITKQAQRSQILLKLLALRQTDYNAFIDLLYTEICENNNEFLVTGATNPNTVSIVIATCFVELIDFGL